MIHLWTLSAANYIWTGYMPAACQMHNLCLDSVAEITCKKTDASSILLVFSGCWEMSGKADCHQSSCVANKKPSKALNNAKFCCCNTDLCNMNVSVEYVASQGDDPLIEPPGKNHVCRWCWEMMVLRLVQTLSLGGGPVQTLSHTC